MVSPPLSSPPIPQLIMREDGSGDGLRKPFTHTGQAFLVRPGGLTATATKIIGVYSSHTVEEEG